MTSAILTNEISYTIHHQAILDRFYIYEANTNGLARDKYQLVLDKINKRFNPVALVKSHNKSSFYFLVEHRLDIRQSDEYFTLVQHIDFSRLTDFDILKLIIRSLTFHKSQQSNPLNSMPFTTETGIYYCYDSTQYQEYRIYHAYHVDIKKLDSFQDRFVITINTQTFSPKELILKQYQHSSKDFKKISESAEYKMTFFNTPQITKKKSKNKEVVYIKRSPKNNRATSTMLSLDPKNPTKFFNSKCGILVQFMQDVECYLAPYINIHFKEITQDYHRIPDKGYIDKKYDEIKNILKSYPFYLICLDNLESYREEITLYFQNEYNITLQYLKDISSHIESQTSIYIVLHHDKCYYENNGIDPYDGFHQYMKQHKSIIVQSITFEKLLDENTINKSSIENCLTEILVKLEIQFKKLLLQPFPHNNWQCVLPVFDNQDMIAYDCLSYQYECQKLDYQRIAVDNEDWEKWINQTDYAIYEMRSKSDLGKNDCLLIQDNGMDKQYYLIQESTLLPLPELMTIHQYMQCFDIARNYGFETKWAEEYLKMIESSQIQLTSKNTQGEYPILDKLKTINNYSHDKIDIKTFDKIGIQYRSKDEKNFFDWIYLTYGYLYNTSLRDKNSNLINSVKDFYYHHGLRLYIAGLYQSPENKIIQFNHMRKISTYPVLDDIPKDLFSLIENYVHIRHRQSTVLPFLFKHLREYIALCYPNKSK